MDVHPTKNDINRYWSIPSLPKINSRKLRWSQGSPNLWAQKEQAGLDVLGQKYYPPISTAMDGFLGEQLVV